MARGSSASRSSKTVSNRPDSASARPDARSTTRRTVTIHVFDLPTSRPSDLATYRTDSTPDPYTHAFRSTDARLAEVFVNECLALLTGQCLPILRCVRMRHCKYGSSCSSRTVIKRIPTRIPASAGHAPKRPTMGPGIRGPVRRLPCPAQPAATPRCTQREPHTEGKYEEVCSNRTKKLKNNTSRVSRPAISSTSRLLG